MKNWYYFLFRKLRQLFSPPLPSCGSDFLTSPVAVWWTMLLRKIWIHSNCSTLPLAHPFLSFTLPSSHVNTAPSPCSQASFSWNSNLYEPNVSHLQTVRDASVPESHMPYSLLFLHKAPMVVSLRNAAVLKSRSTLGSGKCALISHSIGGSQLLNLAAQGNGFWEILVQLSVEYMLPKRRGYF